MLSKLWAKNNTFRVTQTVVCANCALFNSCTDRPPASEKPTSGQWVLVCGVNARFGSRMCATGNYLFNRSFFGAHPCDPDKTRKGAASKSTSL